ncbi:VOC family protein [Terricaulis sp.]|uniref:VOC family protein n=1 Tax=Terricaulis sp. TaxID=2768686 RepID=UPI002AC63529|nr:VOC family protein [Terricaulis sp.]MDZ4691493.1 VOC family protein [Terricaulis sp.]
MPVAISCVTLPVDDLQKSLAFYQNVMGFSPDEQDEDHAAFDVDGVYLVLLNRGDFSVYVEGVGHRPAARGQSESILSHFAESTGEVDALIAKAKGAGATVSEAEDDDGVYSGSFTDPDGHVWEVLYDAA